jgi:stage V sporulation protein SpoVS
VGKLRIVGGFALALALMAAAPASAAGSPRILDLADGYRFELLGAGATEARVANPKTIYVNVALTDDKLQADTEHLVEAADRMFESVLMNPAEKGYYKRALVNIRRAGGTAFEEFLYLRGANEVWLRQAGKEPWKRAQDPAAWKPPASEKIEIEEFGTFAVETAVEIQAPTGFTRAAEIDFVTKTSLIDIQRKYQEIKALWARIDREQMRKDGFDLIVFGNFAQPQLGRFHARKGFFVRIPRAANGEWAELPDSAPDDRDVLISKVERSNDALVQTIAYTFTFEGSPETLRFANFATPAVSPHLAPVPAGVAFGFSMPALRFAPENLLNLNTLAITTR